jgi:hypothetical protein
MAKIAPWPLSALSKELDATDSSMPRLIGFLIDLQKLEQLGSHHHHILEAPASKKCRQNVSIEKLEQLRRLQIPSKCQLGIGMTLNNFISRC